MINWGSHEGRKRKPCREDPGALSGKPIGMYHCSACGVMVLAGVLHTSPEAPPAEEQDPRYHLDDYEDEYGRPWPPGYEEETNP